MFSQITMTQSATVYAAVHAAQSLLDSVHATIKAEVATVSAALSSMNFSKFAVEGPMLTGAWDAGTE